VGSVAHLQGKRTGRRKGSRSRPHWLRAIRWAESQIERPGGKPPSKLASLLFALGQEHPDRLAMCIAKADEYEQAMQQTARRERAIKAAAAEPATEAHGKPAPASPLRSRNVRTLNLNPGEVRAWLKSCRAPYNAKIVRCEMDGDCRMLVTISSESTLPMDRWSVQHWIAAQPRVPPDAHLVKCELAPNGTIVMTVQSDQFTYVRPGAPIPEFYAPVDGR
jgi:hypothetical protein